MIIQSVSTVLDTANRRDRTTFFKTVADPATKKTTVEAVQFLYDRKGQIKPNNMGQNVDRRV
jgi:hypothetical protein